MKRSITVLLIAACTIVVWGTWSQSALSHENITTTVLFDREIVRILNKKCVACHAENTLAFPLTTYVQTRPWANAIKEQALRRHMPPWRAVSGYGQFANDLGLTVRETQFIVAWVEGNGPKSADQTAFTNLENLKLSTDGATLKPDFDQWKLGKPDLARQLAPSVVAAGEGDVVKQTVVDLGLTSARWVRALDFKPGDRHIVRAAFFSLQDTGQWLGSWTPWYGVTTLPNGTAYRLPPGSRVVVEMHYRSAQKTIEERGTLGLYFAKSAPSSSPSDLVLQATGDIPASGTKRLHAVAKLPSDSYILSLRPDFRPGAQSIEVTAKSPDGREQPLLFVKDILLDWPTPYVLKEPVLLARDSEISFTSYYANAGLDSRPASVKLTISQYQKGAGQPATR